MAEPVNRFAVEVNSAGKPVANRFSTPPVDFSRIGEFDAKGASAGQVAKLVLGYFTTPDEKARADIIRETLPGATFQTDPNNGRVVVTYKGETGYIDKPGVTLGGVFDTILQAAKYLPVGKFAAGGANIAAQVLRAGVGSAVVSVAEDAAAIPQGSQQGISPEKAVITGVAGATGQAVSPIVDKAVGWISDKGVKVWKVLRNNPGAVGPDGSLTQAGRKIAEGAGLNPDDVSPQIARQLETAAYKATAAWLPDEKIPIAKQRQALSQRFGVPLTKGELTDDYAQQSLEENLKKMDVTTKAGNIMRTAEQNAYTKLRGDDGTTGFGLLKTEISPEASADISQAGQQVISITQRQAELAKEGYRGAYKTARESGAALDARNYKEFLSGAEATLKDAVDYDPNLYPQTAKVLDNLRKRGVFMDESGRSAPRQIPLSKLENIRKIINAQWKSADATDRMGLDVLRNQFDEMVNGALDSGRVIGDESAVQAWKQGRQLYARYRQLYAPNPQGGQAEKSAGRIVENWLKSDSVTGEEIIRQAVNNKALTSRIIEINGVNSPAHVALKQGVLEYVFRPALKNEGISPRLIVSQFDRFFKGSSSEQVRAVFSPSELKAINEFVQLSKAKIPQQGVVNYSNTGNVLMKAVQQLGQKLGVIGAATGHFETAAAMGAVGAASNAAKTAQAKSAVRGLTPTNRVSAPVVAGSASIGAQYDQ